MNIGIPAIQENTVSFLQLINLPFCLQTARALRLLSCFRLALRRPTSCRWIRLVLAKSEGVYKILSDSTEGFGDSNIGVAIFSPPHPLCSMKPYRLIFRASGKISPGRCLFVLYTLTQKKSIICYYCARFPIKVLILFLYDRVNIVK